MLKYNEDIFKQKIDVCMFFYGESDSTFDEFKKIPNIKFNFHNGLPDTIDEFKMLIREHPIESHKVIFIKLL